MCGLRDRGLPGGKPFYLLQLDPVPRRIADNGIKTAREFSFLPIGPDTRECDLPRQEALFRNEGASSAKDASEALCLLAAFRSVVGLVARVRFAECDIDWVAEDTIEELAHDDLV